MPDGADGAVYTDEYYGALKALCEKQVLRIFEERATILRPGLVAGPYDPTDRFTYWPVRFDDGGNVLGPERRSRLQYIDVRDLAAFAVGAANVRFGGTLNCVTPRGSLTFGDLYDACLAETSAEDAKVLPMPDDFLTSHGVRPWSELPLWIPAQSPYSSISNAGSENALSAGMRVRPLRETVRDTLAWARASGKQRGALKAGLLREREAELVAAVM